MIEKWNIYIHTEDMMIICKILMEEEDNQNSKNERKNTSCKFVKIEKKNFL